MSASGQKLPFDIYQDPSISAVQSCLINHYHPGVMALDEERALQFRCPVQTPTAPLITDGALTEGRQHQVISELEMYPLTPSGHPWNQAALRVADKLKAETNGRLTMTVFHAGQLHTLNQ